MKISTKTLSYTSIIFLITLISFTPIQAQTIQDSLRTILNRADTSLYGINLGGEYLFFGGASAALIAPSNQVFTAVSGQAGVGVDMMDTFRLGISDVTQTMLATLTFALMQENRLMLTQPISTYLSGVTLTNVPGSITIRQLLSHTSGLDEFSNDATYTSTVLFDVNRNFTPTELTQQFVGPVSGAGTFRYSNTNFLVLGVVLEAANGTETLQESLNRLILTPAGIATDSNSVRFYPGRDPVNLAPLFADVFANGFPSQLTPNLSIFSGASFAGNIIATPTQLVRFLRALATGRIINSANLQEMLNFTATSGRLNGRYGLGIEQFSVIINGTQRNVIGHYGDINYVSVALYDPTDSVGVAIISNNALARPEGLVQVATRFFGAFRALRSTSISSFVLKQAQFQLYPNPTSQLLNVNYELLQSAQVRMSLFNTLGQIVLNTASARKPVGEHIEQIDVTSLSTGTYMFRLEIGGQTATQLIVIQ